MAIVRNLGYDDTTRQVDPPLSTPNRTNAGSPIGVLDPLFIDELVFDSTNFRLYRATGLTNTSWMIVP